MSVHVGLSAGTVVRPKAKPEAVIKAEQRAAVAIQAAAFVRADCATQADVLQMLLAQGRICDICGDVSDEYGDVADAAADDYDSEVDFADDDEARDEGVSFNTRTASGGDDEHPLASASRAYEIRIVRKGDGWSCVPPPNPLTGCRASAGDSEAQLIVDAVRKQFAFYAKVTAWLQSEGESVLASPSSFVDNHEAMTKEDFFEEFCEDIGMKDNTAFHAYCQACRLSWGDASLPLDCVFGART